MTSGDNNDKNMQRQPSKFGLFMSSVGKSAKKGMSRAGKQMGKGVVKAKLLAIEKIANAECTPEDPEIIAALERLKTTKNEIYQISDIIRNLYDARLNETLYLFQLASRLEKVEVTENDPFSEYVQQMGKALHTLETVANTHLSKMKEEFVEPLERFRDIDVENVQKLKLKYKNRKSEYDLAQHRLIKAKESGEQTKVQPATYKRDGAYADLTEIRNLLKDGVNNLEQKKQVGLLGNFEKYWASYSSFAAAQANILSKCLVVKNATYVSPNLLMNRTPKQAQSQKPMNNRRNNSSNKNGQRNKPQRLPPPPKMSQTVGKPKNKGFQGLVEYTDMSQQQNKPPPIPAELKQMDPEDAYNNPPPPAYSSIDDEAPAERYGDDVEEDDGGDDYNPFGSGD